MRDVVIVFFIFFTIMIACLIIGAVNPKIEFKIEKGGKRITAFDIFINNLAIMLVMIIPLLGWFYAFYQSWLSGNILASISEDVAIGLLALASYPHFWFELTAYSLMCTASYLLITGRPRYSIIFIILAIVTLGIASTLEVIV